eukprot:940022-Pyramimonas_sp.AAC.1
MVQCFDMMSHHALMREAREMGYPIRMLWMLLQPCQQPRRIKAYGSLSCSFVAFSGGAGRVHMCHLPHPPADVLRPPAGQQGCADNQAAFAGGRHRPAYGLT